MTRSRHVSTRVAQAHPWHLQASAVMRRLEDSDVKPDPDYTQRILEVFEGSSTAFVQVHDFEGAGLPNDEQFLFHMLQLARSNLIMDPAGRSVLPIEGRLLPDVAGKVGRGNLMLTPEGYKFLGALRDSTTGGKVKEAVRTRGIEFAVAVAQGFLVELVTRIVGGVA